jgi:hypothetical protein
MARNTTNFATTNPALHEKYRIIQNCYTLLMNRYVRIEDKCQLDLFQHHHPDDINNPFHDKWSITFELLKAVAVCRESDDGTLATFQPNGTTSTTFTFPYHLVHAAVSLKSSGCPIWVLFYLAVHYPEQYTMIDATGRFPLHIAIGPENSFGTVSTKSSHSSSSSQPHPQHWKFVPKEYWSIRLSLHFHPKSAVLCDPNEPVGRYPLHTAIYYGHQWHYGIKLLVNAAPRVLHQCDPTTGLYPFQLAAIVCRYNINTTTDGLELIYEILRYDPSILELCRRRRRHRWKGNDDKSQTSLFGASTADSKYQQQKQIVVGGCMIVILAIVVARCLSNDTLSPTIKIKSEY